MQARLLNLLVTLAASAICLGTFLYKYTRLGETDYVILAAGALLLGIAVLSYSPKQKR